MNGSVSESLMNECFFHGTRDLKSNTNVVRKIKLWVLFENSEFGKTNIIHSVITKKYKVKIYDNGEWIRANNIDTYNRALDIYCDIKQGILVSKAKALKDQIPDKVYKALINTDIKAINSKHYLAGESEV